MKLNPYKCEWCGTVNAMPCRICGRITCYECVKIVEESKCIHSKFTPIQKWEWDYGTKCNTDNK
jgi:hypothetical protein